jgi:hypothetical protein
MIMKLFRRLPVTVAFALFILFCPEDHDIKAREKLPVISYRNDDSRRNANIVAQPKYPEMRNNLSPAEQEEMRRQRNIARSANIEWIKESTKKYSPVSWYMLLQYDNLPESAEAPTTGNGVVSTAKATDTFHYLRGRSRIDLLVSMETNVHEIAHGYFDLNVYRYLRENNMKMNTDNAQGYIYISPSESFFVSFPLKAMFPSGELSVVIPANLRTYRFETYIEGSTSTQSDGVIGLLNELHAYYLGSKYCFDMLEPYKTAAGSDAEGLFEWVTHTQSTMSAFYEIDFFIREYLLYMKKNHTANYEMLRSYRPFTESYITLYKFYKDLIDKYQNRIKDEMKLLNSAGDAGARIEKGWLWVKAGKSNVSSGTPIFSKEKDVLIPMLESRRYRDIEDDFPMK